MQQATQNRTTSPAPVEAHPDYAAVMWERDLAKEVMTYDLEASRWVSGLLATIMGNAALLSL